MFEQYPKTKSFLPDKYAAILQKHYLENRGGHTKTTIISRKMESWMHVQVAADVAKSLEDVPTLEIGGGTLNHLAYEPHVTTYDVVEPKDEFYEHLPQQAKVRRFFKSVFEIPDDSRYQRIISIATLEHLTDLPSVVARSATLLKEGGHFRVAIPNEGTLLWKLGYKLTTGIEFRLRYGLSYDVLMRHEHVSIAKEIDEVLAFFFASRALKVLGWHKDFAFYRFYDCTSPDHQRCLTFIRDHQL
jgi:hypothetical protein